MATVRFSPGLTYITRGALLACESFPMPPHLLLTRHLEGNWGDLGKADKRRNEEALKDGSRIFSAYQIGEHRFYVITEADRSSTTILLAYEY
jgi:hypothetical protein